MCKEYECLWQHKGKGIPVPYKINTLNLDGLKEAEVKDGDDEEGEEEHGHKVGDEDVVACVGLRYSQFRGAEYRYLWFLSFNCSVVWEGDKLEGIRWVRGMFWFLNSNGTVQAINVRLGQHKGLLTLTAIFNWVGLTCISFVIFAAGSETVMFFELKHVFSSKKRGMFHNCWTELIFVTDITVYIRGEKIVIWRNFSFPCMIIVGKLKISPHVEKFQYNWRGFIAIYAFLLLNLLFMQFCCNIFATIYVLSCGEKLSPKVHLWRIMTNMRSAVG